MTTDPKKGFPDYRYSFTGSDYRVTYISKNTEGLNRVLTGLQTLSFSTHSDLFPGRRLGEKGVHGYAVGTKTVAGTMIFLFRGNDPFLEEIAISEKEVKGNTPYETRPCHLEAIPEFDLIIQATSEVPLYDAQGKLKIHNTKMFLGGIKLSETGGTLSIHDVYTEIMYTFVAREQIPFASSIPDDTISRITQNKNQSSSIQSLLNQYNDQLDEFRIRRGKS